MKWTKRISGAFAALALGMWVLGCSLFAHDDRPENEVGSFCAAPANGGEFCVSAKQPPGNAWQQAASHGGMPIQMWAKWPSSVTLDELVESNDNLNAWFADIKTVTFYVRDTQRSAESYKASLAGNLGTLLRQANQRQAAILAAKPTDATANFKAILIEHANWEKSPLVATIADDKQAMAAAHVIVEKAKTDLAPLQANYASLAGQFTAYRATEAAEAAAYAALAQQASQSMLDTLDAVEQATLAASLSASGKPNDLVLNAMKLSAELQAFALAYQKAIKPYLDFLATHGAAVPDLTSDALRSLDAMLGYMQQRVARSDATATLLIDGIAARKQALATLTAPAPARTKIAEARLLKASTSFSAEASARVAVLGKAPPTSRAIKLPYLAERVAELTALLLLQPLCEVSSASWREAGCVSLRANFGAAETSLKTTIPALITTGLATMRAKGADSAMLDAAQAKLQRGDVKGAAIVYDAAVHLTEGT